MKIETGIYDRVSYHHFYQALQNSGSYQNKFSFDACKAIFEHLEQLSGELNEPIEFDPIAWCCEFVEVEDLVELKNDFGVETIEELEDQTTVISREPLVFAAY